jgi:excisionase family DNA binding protein
LEDSRGEPLDPRAPESWPELLKVSEVAELIRVSEPTVRSMIRRGELEGSKTGRSWRVRASSLRKLLGEVDPN